MYIYVYICVYRSVTGEYVLNHIGWPICLGVTLVLHRPEKQIYVYIYIYT